MKIAFEWFDTDINILGIKRYIPICELEIRKKDGTWVPFIFKIDSGADTILMKESDCRDLGYSLADCEQVEFDTASDKSVKTRVQMLDVRISGYAIEQIPIAFSVSPIKTLLLGRAKLFETLDICFLHEHKNTVFAS
jgi:gag-polyprotein putative aspartyl protease